MICPLLASGAFNIASFPEDSEYQCRGVDCAWYDIKAQGCSVWSLASEIHSITTAAEELVRVISGRLKVR